MPFKERINIPKGQPGYLSKSEVADYLKDNYKKEYTASQLKKIKREELIAEYLKLEESSQRIMEGLHRAAKRRKKSFKEVLHDTFSRFRY